MNNFQKLVQEHESQNQKGQTVDSLNSIPDYLHIELLYGDYRNEKNQIYAVLFRNKRGDGRTSITLKLYDLFHNSKESYLELKPLFGMSRSVYHNVLDHIDKLVENDQYTSVSNIVAVMNPSPIYEKAVKLYQAVSEKILSQVNRYPLQSSNHFQKGDSGMIPDDHIENGIYDSDVIAVTKEHLLELLDQQNSIRLNSILRAWIKLGYLIKTSKQEHRLQEQISIKYLASAPRFYILWIRDLENKRKEGK